MKKLIQISLVLLILAGTAYSARSQGFIILKSGQNMTNFMYTDEDGHVDYRYKPLYSTSYNLGFAYYLKKGVFFQTRVGIRKAGSTYSYDDFNYRWDIQYADYRLGLGYKYDFKKIYFRFATEGYIGYVLQAEQRLFDTERDMVKAKTIDRLDYGMFFSPGIGYGLTEKISIELNINYMLGLGNLDKDPGQTTQNRLWGTDLGLNIKI